jgi:hypothetical protein
LMGVTWKWWKITNSSSPLKLVYIEVAEDI